MYIVVKVFKSTEILRKDRSPEFPNAAITRCHITKGSLFARDEPLPIVKAIGSIGNLLPF
jgi:hypothetical protein